MAMHNRGHSFGAPNRGDDCGVDNPGEMSAQPFTLPAILHEIGRKGGFMTELRRPITKYYRKTDVDIEALARTAPVINKPGDLVNPDLFPDDAEFEEFIAWIRAERQRDLA